MVPGLAPAQPGSEGTHTRDSGLTGSAESEPERQEGLPSSRATSCGVSDPGQCTVSSWGPQGSRKAWRGSSTTGIPISLQEMQRAVGTSRLLKEGRTLDTRDRCFFSSLPPPASHHLRGTVSAFAPSYTSACFIFPKLSKVKGYCRPSVSTGFTSTDSTNCGSKTVFVTHSWESADVGG